MLLMFQLIVILAGTNNHGHTALEIVQGLVEIVKTCQEKQPQADVLVMVCDDSISISQHIDPNSLVQHVNFRIKYVVKYAKFVT